ncbi:MAG: hypothetical protein ACXVW7_19080 [Trebonia sp.]
MDEQGQLVEQSRLEQEPDEGVLAPTAMSPPGCCLSVVMAAATSPVIAEVGPQPGSPSGRLAC